VVIRVPKEKPFRGFRNFCVRFPALALRSPEPYLAGMTLKEIIQKYFRRKAATQTPQQERLRVGDGTSGMGQGVGPVPLRIEGVKPAPLTPEPDDAELAAQALLESLASPEQNRNDDISEYRNNGKHDGKADQPRDAAYYHALADRIRTARTDEARLVMRLLASVEEQLAEPTALYKGQWGDTERKLYRAMDVAEREGGELKHRWQHCLATVIVRRMEEEREATEDGRRKMEELSEPPADPKTTTN